MDLSFVRIRLILIVATCAASTGCASVDFHGPRTESSAPQNVSGTALGDFAAEKYPLNYELSGFVPLPNGTDALGARLRLAAMAEKSLDLQYFLMKGDTAGRVLAAALLGAADRGVRVRFLLDDVFTTTRDRTLLLLNTHPNIEVRLFNPVARRGLRTANYLLSFRRANRRMHNKSFTADNSVTIVGGRNIADEYFDLRDDNVFLDFDVLGVGPIARAVSHEFDVFWNHAGSVPIEQIARAKPGDSLEAARQEFGDALAQAHNTAFASALESPLLNDLFERQEPIVAAKGRVLADRPNKLLNTAPVGAGTVSQLRDALSAAQDEVLIVTPYYVPLDSGVEFMQDLAKRGVRAIIVTNSLAANNHTAVHSAYSSYRKPVLDTGAQLFEVRANAARELGGESGPDSLTLHTKLFIIDGRQLFVGSINFDPRSIVINAEMGILIDSPELAGPLRDRIVALLPNVAYQVQRSESGRLEWTGRVNGVNVIESHEPLSGRWRRFMAWLLKIVPDSQL
jgi:putative cardiolipin synthase